MVKCLVWDLDNTLWQGTLAEGDQVRMTGAVRGVVAELDARGILQAISSKNDHDLAWARLVELGVADYFGSSNLLKLNRRCRASDVVMSCRCRGLMIESPTLRVEPR